MKVNELENLIRESVKETLSQKPTKKKRGKKALKEGAEFSGGSLGADIALEPKVERAVMFAAHCAKVITGGVPRSPDVSGSALEKCFDDILGLFLDPQGEFSVPDLNPDELRHEFATQLSHQMTNPGSKIAKVTRLILDKVVDKLNVYVGEAMITEAGKEIPTDPGWFDTQTDTEMHSREPRRETLCTIESFHKMVREMIQEAIKEQMVNELDRLNLKELGGVQGSGGTGFSEPTTGTSGTTATSGTKPGIQTQSGNGDVANNVMVQGTNLNVNQGLQAAAKDPNFKKKAEMIAKIANQISGMKGVVIK